MYIYRYIGKGRMDGLSPSFRSLYFFVGHLKTPKTKQKLVVCGLLFRFICLALSLNLPPPSYSFIEETCQERSSIAPVSRHLAVCVAVWMQYVLQRVMQYTLQRVLQCMPSFVSLSPSPLEFHFL